MKLEQPLQCVLLSASSVFAAPQSYPANGTTPAEFSSKCADVASKLAVDGAFVHTAEFVAAGTNLTLPLYDQTCAEASPRRVRRRPRAPSRSARAAAGGR